MLAALVSLLLLAPQGALPRAAPPPELIAVEPARHDDAALTAPCRLRNGFCEPRRLEPASRRMGEPARATGVRRPHAHVKV